MTRRPSRVRLAAAWLALSALIAACGETVLVREIDTRDGAVAAPGEIGDPQASADATPSAGVSASAAPGTDTGPGNAGPGATTGPTARPRNSKKCATAATDVGVGRDEIVWGTILPLSGPTRPLGEQTARVMQRAVAFYNRQTSDPNRPDLDWGCPGRPGIYGREVKLKIAPIQSDSEDDVLAAMRRLVDVEKVFLVRDCYLQASLMGPAQDYAERKGVITHWCFPESLPQPQLSPNSWAPGISSEDDAALLTGYMIRKLGKRRIALLYDPTYEETAKIVKKVIDRLGAQLTIEVRARAQTAVNGRRSEVLAIRQSNPDAVMILDALNGTYAGVAAGQLQWRPKDSGVTWACNKCWLKFQADVCGESCEGMLTNTAIVPFKPYNAGAKVLHDTKKQIFANEPDDVLTYAALLITGGLFIDLADAGPNLTRAALNRVAGSKVNSVGGGLPPITTSPHDHFGAELDWIIRFTGRPWPDSFADETGRYIGLREVGVDPAWSRE